MKINFFKFFSLLFLLTIMSCEEDDPIIDLVDNTGPFLEHSADNIIIPAYAELEIRSETLALEVEAFIQDPAQEKLDQMRMALKDTWLQWQVCSPFEFGPAFDQDIKARINTFPADDFEIQTRIEAGEDAFISNDTWGFPAMDFLINGASESDPDILLLYSSDVHASARGNYLKEISQDIHSRIDLIHTDWISEYRNEFIDKTGTAAGSSLSLLVNAFVADYEQLKRDRIALPLGLLTLGISLPDKVEAYYGGYSGELATHHCSHLLSYFQGNGQKGLDYLLDEVEANIDGESLSDIINTGFSNSVLELSEIQDPLSDFINSNPDDVAEAYDALQDQLIYIKSNMPSSLGISISFTDNDGD